MRHETKLEAGVYGGLGKISSGREAVGIFYTVGIEGRVAHPGNKNYVKLLFMPITLAGYK
jgi:hypothetical protein